MKKKILVLSLILLISSYFTTNADSFTTDAMLKFNMGVYVGLYSTATVTVRDQDSNLRSKYTDTARIRITSDADPKGFILLAYETDINTGVFSGILKFTTDATSSNNAAIRVNATDNIVAAYIDERTAKKESSLVITATASFQFFEATIETSAAKDAGAGNILDITITDHDAKKSGVRDRIIAKAGSYDSTDDMTLWLTETGSNTGKFEYRLYLNDENTTASSLQVAPTDRVNIKYIDKTVPQGGIKEIVKTVKWIYQSTTLMMDKEAYTGYNSSAKISLINMELNKDENKAESVDVKVSSSSSSDDIKLELEEDSSDSGEFSGTLYFGKSSSSSKGVVKVKGRDTIVVSYMDKKDNDGAVERSAYWTPHNGQLTLDRGEYKGNGVPVRITVKDWDMAYNINEEDRLKVAVKIMGSTKDMPINLTETYKNTGTFSGILYINGSGSDEKPSIDLDPGDKLKVVYEDKDTTSGNDEDRNAYAVWGGISESRLVLDKDGYYGYDTYMKITLEDQDQNKKTTSRDKVDVLVKTKRGNTNMKYTLTETGSNTGIFSAKLKLTKKAPKDGNIRVADTDDITVNFREKGVSAEAVFRENVFSKSDESH